MMSASSRFSTRSKRLVQLALLNVKETYVEPKEDEVNVSDRCEAIQHSFEFNNSLSFVPEVRCETSSYFLGNIENRDELSHSHRKTMRWLLNYDSESEKSTYDDSDQDRTYSPSRSSSSDDELNENMPQKRVCKLKKHQKKEDNKNCESGNAEQDKTEQENVDGKENIEKAKKLCKLKKQQKMEENKNCESGGDTTMTSIENIDAKGNAEQDKTEQQENVDGKENVEEATRLCKLKKQQKKEESKNCESRGTIMTSIENINAKGNTEQDEIEQQGNVDGMENVDEANIEENSQEDKTTGTKLRKQKGTFKRGKEKMLEKAKNQHLMISKCNGKCRKRCSMLTEKVRSVIWETFWSLDYSSRRKWMSKHITLVPVKRRLVNAKNARKDSRVYSLPLPDGTEEKVCRLTFLNTLGYKNDSVLTHLVASMKEAPCGKMVKERRGIHPKPYLEIDKTPIIEHINSFHPCVSHYRRKNAPNVKYLSRELSCQFMFNDFKEKNPNIKCSSETYRKVIKDMNISFYMPNSDKCEDCQSLENKISEAVSEDSKDEAMAKLQKHKEKAKNAENEYKKDAERSSTNANIRFYSMDLQKVIILPVMPESKSSFFTSRLIVFNETFATLKPDLKNSSYCVFWHEALGSRKAESIADAVLQVIETERDAEEFVFWADNCSSQNKNYVIYSFLVSVVNSPEGPRKVTVKYLTKGHTHMTADGIHGNIEKKILKKRNVYDFKDLIETAESARKGLKVLLLEKFHVFQNKKRTTKKSNDPIKEFVLGNVVEASFEKGKFTMDFKYDFNDAPTTIDLFQKKYITELESETPKIKTLPVRGINKSKKETILRILAPLMPENRRHFWFNLPESETSSDSTSNEEYHKEKE